MNQAEILLTVIESGKIGLRVDSEEALILVASLIDRLDKASDTYPKDMADLISVGTCIWQLQLK